MSDEIPANLKYTTDHEWADVAGSDLNVGITKFAVEQLGDVTLVTVDVKVGDEVTAGKSFGTIESVKTLSELLAPVSGKITKINVALEKNPELVNDDCYAAWMVTITPKDPAGVSKLLDAEAYAEHVKTSAH